MNTKRLLALLILFLPGLSWGGGSLSGTVLYQGLPPPVKKRPVTIDESVCGRSVDSEELLVDKKGGLKNAVVFLQGAVAGAKGFSVPKGGLVLDQKRCRFEPHVLIVPAGSEWQVLNSDHLVHSLHTGGRTNPPVNRVQLAGVARLSFRFDRAEIFPLWCDIHRGMQAWVVVADHPYYALTDDEGRFRLTDIPAGDYTLEVRHETLGSVVKRVQVAEEEETRVEFKMAERH